MSVAIALAEESRFVYNCRVITSNVVQSFSESAGGKLHNFFIQNHSSCIGSVNVIKSDCQLSL